MEDRFGDEGVIRDELAVNTVVGVGEEGGEVVLDAVGGGGLLGFGEGVFLGRGRGTLKLRTS